MNVHYHHAPLIWLLFFVGECLHVALQTDDLARKNKSTWTAILSDIGVRVLYRAFVCSMIFLVIWYYPNLISNAAKMLGHPLSADEGEVVALPMNYALAGLWGLFLDSAIGYVPFLKSQLPQLEQ